jgi:hypothetical protein
VQDGSVSDSLLDDDGSSIPQCVATNHQISLQTESGPDGAENAAGIASSQRSDSSPQRRLESEPEAPSAPHGGFYPRDPRRFLHTHAAQDGNKNPLQTPRAEGVVPGGGAECGIQEIPAASCGEHFC